MTTFYLLLQLISKLRSHIYIFKGASQFQELIHDLFICSWIRSYPKTFCPKTRTILLSFILLIRASILFIFYLLSYFIYLLWLFTLAMLSWVVFCSVGTYLGHSHNKIWFDENARDSSLTGLRADTIIEDLSWAVVITHGQSLWFGLPIPEQLGSKRKNAKGRCSKRDKANIPYSLRRYAYNCWNIVSSSLCTQREHKQCANGNHKTGNFTNSGKWLCLPQPLLQMNADYYIGVFSYDIPLKFLFGYHKIYFLCIHYC